MDNSYSNLREDIHKVLCEFLNYEHEILNDGEFDYEFLEFKTDDILRIIKNCGGDISNYKTINKKYED